MFDGLMEDVFNTTALLPVAGVGEEPEYGGEEDDGDGEDEVLAKVPLAPEGAEVAVVDVDEVTVLSPVVVRDAKVAHEVLVVDAVDVGRVGPLHDGDERSS